MNYFKVTIFTTHDAADVIADSLSPITGACVIDDPRTVDELIAAPSPRWDYIGEEVFENADRPVTVCFWTENSDDGRDILDQVDEVLAEYREGGTPPGAFTRGLYDKGLVTAAGWD